MRYYEVTKPPPGVRVDRQVEGMESLIGAWIFNDGSGKNVSDSSGYDHDGLGDAGFSHSANKVGQCGNFSSGIVTVGGSNNFFNLTELSIVFGGIITSTTGWRHILTKRVVGSSTWGISGFSATNRLCFYTGAWHIYQSSADIVLNDYTFAAFTTKSPPANNSLWYVNGKTGGAWTTGDGSAALPATTDPVGIGGIVGGAEYYVGSINFIYLFDKRISLELIGRLHGAPYFMYPFGEF